ncbi:MAG: LptF/LptG family permease [Candidatus Omnitrophica bacterium]|nr:LptF/LptG family permease [Candidatus Omnitrophota bacterium]MCM8797945.1 LptF/LptG family permease [Candidatus Omnitrophota bacterium]
MRIVEKYILKNFSIPLLYTLIAFIFLFIIADLFGHLDEFIRNRISSGIILNYYLYSLPLIIVQVLPFAGLVASIYSLGNLQRYNEMIAMYASGIGLLKVLRPYVATGIVLSLITYLLNERVNPYAFRNTYNLKEQFEKNKPQKGYIENVTLYGKDNRIIYARRYDRGKKILYDLVILEQDRNQVITSKITVRLAVWEGKGWKLYGAVLYRLDPEGRFVGEPVFLEEREIELNESPDDIIRNDLIPEAMNIEQLRQYIERFRSSTDKIVRRFLVDLQRKKAMSLYVLVLILIGMPFGIIQQSIGKFVSLGIAFATGVLFYGLNAVSLGMAKAGLIPPFLSAWIVPFIFIVFSLILLKRSPH